jgi:hypothetical protein
MSNERGVGIHALSDEVLVHFLSYLQAKELGVLNMVDRTVFCVKRLQMAVKTIMRTSLVIPLTSPLKRQQSLACCLHTPSSLFVFEVCNILAALSTPIPLTEHKGKIVLNHYKISELTLFFLSILDQYVMVCASKAIL